MPQEQKSEKGDDTRPATETPFDRRVGIRDVTSG
jgi:hypothetical protein